ncbi:hypothetical protein GALL_382230 [mine drainage metagenome]|uniref:Uncharacterized protein n=1 Tax=mine drainage metagenome TaxID=410659 RepID=A0A1J5QJA6_9ZZZZ
MLGDFGANVREFLVAPAQRVAGCAVPRRRGGRGGQALARQRRGEGAPGRGLEQRHHAADAQRDVQRLPSFDQAHDGRAEIAPHRKRHRVAGARGELVDHRFSRAQRIELLQAAEANAQRRRPQGVAAAAGELFDQAQAPVTDQIRVSA